MREIKFRYICKRENGHTFSRIFTLEQIESGEVRQWWELNLVGKNELHKNQYIGNKDIDNKDIYEDDILEWHYNVNVKDLWIVKATNGGWNPFIDNMDTDDSWHYRIIGNKHQNPELVKV